MCGRNIDPTFFISLITHHVANHDKNCINCCDPNIVWEKMCKYYNIKHFINKPTMVWIWPHLRLHKLREAYSTARVLVISAIVFYHFNKNICDKRLFVFFSLDNVYYDSWFGWLYELVCCRFIFLLLNALVCPFSKFCFLFFLVKKEEELVCRSYISIIHIIYITNLR